MLLQTFGKSWRGWTGMLAWGVRHLDEAQLCCDEIQIAAVHENDLASARFLIFAFPKLCSGVDACVRRGVSANWKTL